MKNNNPANQPSIQTVPNNYQMNNDTFDQNMEDQNSRVNQSNLSPDERGSNSVSGSTSTPDSDDDVLKNAHQVGIAIDEDLENPQELDLAKNVADAEEYRKTH